MAGGFVLAATRFNSNPVSYVQSTSFWPCSLFGQSDACSAGGATTGFLSEVQHEHSDVELAETSNDLTATPLLKLHYET